MVMGVGRVALEAIGCGVPVLSVNQKRLGNFISTENYPVYKKNNFVAVENHPPDENRLIDLLGDFFADLRFWQLESKILQEYANNDLNRLKISASIGTLYDETIKIRRKSKEIA